MKKVRIGLLSLCLLAVGAVAQTSAPGVTAIFVEDQRDRGLPLADNGRDLLSEAQAKKQPHVSDDAMGRRDVERRARVAVLLKEGSLKTGRDFFEASVVFQHGATADDYLLAHVRGEGSADAVEVGGDVAGGGLCSTGHPSAR